MLCFERVCKRVYKCDMVDDINSRRSTRGYLIIFVGVMSCQSKLQPQIIKEMLRSKGFFFPQELSLEERQGVMGPSNSTMYHTTLQCSPLFPKFDICIRNSKRKLGTSTQIFEKCISKKYMYLMPC